MGKFALLRGASPWLKPSEEAWGDVLMEWVLVEARAVKISDSTVLGTISGIRSIHFTRGEPDFAKHNGRRKMLPKSLKRGTVPKVETPLPIEMLERAVTEYRNHG